MPYIRINITIAHKLESINPVSYEVYFQKPTTKGLIRWLLEVMEKIWHTTEDVIEKEAYKAWQEYQEIESDPDLKP